MPKESRERPEAVEHDVDGHRVRIVRVEDREELWIDGRRRKFVTNSGGYVLMDNAYVPARASLLDAVRAYLAQAEPRRSPKKSGDR